MNEERHPRSTKYLIFVATMILLAFLATRCSERIERERKFQQIKVTIPASADHPEY